MSKFKVNYEMEISVKFHDKVKAMNYFQGDFKDYFWSISDMEEAAESVANQFIHERNSYAKEIFLEGFGEFSRVRDKRDVWENCKESQDTLGKITIELENDLEAIYTTEED